MASTTNQGFWDVETAYLDTHISSPPEVVTTQSGVSEKKTAFWNHIDLYDPDFKTDVDDHDEKLKFIDQSSET